MLCCTRLGGDVVDNFGRVFCYVSSVTTYPQVKLLCLCLEVTSGFVPNGAQVLGGYVERKEFVTAPG